MAEIRHVDGAKIHFKVLLSNVQSIHIEKDNHHVEIMLFVVEHFASPNMPFIAILNDDASWSYLLKIEHQIWPSFNWTTSHETILRIAGFSEIFSGDPQPPYLTTSLFNFNELSDGTAIRQYASLRYFLHSFFVFGKAVVDLILQYHAAPWENRSSLRVCKITKKSKPCLIL
jgi:hypothetical protein